MHRMGPFAVLFLFLCSFPSAKSEGQQAPDFSGNWALKLGTRTLMEVHVTPRAQGSGAFGGTLIGPKQFSPNGSGFSNIKGPIVHYPIVQSSLKGNCLSLTVEDTVDKSDQSTFQLCLTGKDRATLRPDFPGVDAWPIIREKTPSTIAIDWDSTKSHYLEDSDISNPEMQLIFERDQNDRLKEDIDWTTVNKADAERREATAKLLRDGKLHTGQDFENAAFIFQHGGTSDDYLLAHTLAMVAVARGSGHAIWIAAATLDRYLNAVHQPQIYGTQFWTNQNQPTTQEPYNRSLVSDALRKYLNVPSQALQEEQRKQFESSRKQN